MSANRDFPAVTISLWPVRDAATTVAKKKQQRGKTLHTEHVPVKAQSIVYLGEAHESTELSTKHLSDVIRMLVSRMVLIEARTSAVSRGF